MHFWESFWQTLVAASRANPPRFVELLMLSLAVLMLLLWLWHDQWPYLLLSASYVLGSGMSLWVREWMTPHSGDRRRRLSRATALLGLTAMLMLLSLQELSQ
ncbi:MAG: hypothetical protein EYR95_14915 [Phormidium sp. SL48-SHIP]|jgi:hypothetical protein|nr:MAG: hypothetical protein EYR95_14915 [Phormidium sp. SL48-SHIP]